MGERDVEYYELELISQLRLVIHKHSATYPEIETALRKLVSTMRDQGAPPERVIVTVKGAAFKAGAGPMEQNFHSGKRRALAILETLVPLSINTYFEDRPSVFAASGFTSERTVERAELRLIAEIINEFEL